MQVKLFKKVFLFIYINHIFSNRGGLKLNPLTQLSFIYTTICIQLKFDLFILK